MQSCDNSLQDMLFVEGAEIRKELFPPDTNPSGQLNTTGTPPVSIEGDFLIPSLLKPISESFQMNLFPDFPLQTSLSSEVLAQTYPLLGCEKDSLEIAQACFLKESDFCDFKSLRHLSLKMSPESSAAITAKTLPLSLVPSLNWGIWAVGKNATDLDMSPKTENEFSLLVFTGDVRCNLVERYRLALTDCLDDGGIAVVDRARGGDRIYKEIAPTIRTASRDRNGKQGGSGAFKVLREDGTKRPLCPNEVEKLMGWDVSSTAMGINTTGETISISNTQRHRMLGNGIIPAEIENICNNLRPFLEAMIDAGID